MQTFRIPTPAELAAKKSGTAQAQPEKAQATGQAIFKGHTNDGMAIYHIPGGLF